MVQQVRRHPDRLDLPHALAAAEFVHPATVFGRDAWVTVGGFDETLSHGIVNEFCLRLLARGFRGAAIDEPLMIRNSVDAATGDAAGVVRAPLDAVIEQHRPDLSRLLADAVCERDRHLESLRHAGQELNHRRAATEQALHQIRSEVESATIALNALDRGRIEFGDLHRLTPISSEWGADRGRCIDRYYIEQFVERHAADVRGRVLEVHDADYTVQYGGARVTHSDVIDIDPMNPRATVIADLRNAPAIPADSYDCFIMTQTLHVIYDMRAVLREALRVLAPGGVLLATLPCASRMAPEQGLDGDFWRFTASSARRLFGEFFSPQQVTVKAYGNVLVNIAYLYGLACHELTDEEFETHDPFFPLIISVRAIK